VKARLVLVVALGGLGLGRPAAAQLRLRADALAAIESPVGLVSLEATTELQPWLRAEALVWMSGSERDDGAGDALIAVVEARSPGGGAAARLGRLIAMVGALRPLHLDGAWASAQLPWQLSVEGFAGVPVAEGMAGRSADWLAGGRIGRRLGDLGGVGLAYLQQRDHGSLAAEEVALDAGAALSGRSDAAARLSFDLIGAGIAEAQLVASTRRGAWRGELYLAQRNASHLLPATSLFSVLGDGAAERAGAVVNVRAAPRLDLTGELGGRRAADELAVEALLRARLWLGDRVRRAAADGRYVAADVGAVGLELRRAGAADEGWTGARATARVPLGAAAGGALVAATELELVIPDDGSRGAAWPWALAALSWRLDCWEAAVAVEASASPELSSRFDVLARLARRWEGL
jgi:hypothetical protein